jgi:hypothetical protein
LEFEFSFLSKSLKIVFVHLLYLRKPFVEASFLGLGCLEDSLSDAFH